jgi:release factor glutamine methyltransferase
MGRAMTVRQALAQSGLIPVDAQVLLAHALSRDRGWLIAHAADRLADVDADAFFALVRRRRDGEPVAYLTGRREFWGLDLVVDRAVLIPRPETETLVECVLQRLPIDRPTRVLDLGTGSGAIALAIARERPLAALWATDRSRTALDVARANAQSLELRSVNWVESDWYRDLPREIARFDVIASNPPYVAVGDPYLGEGDLPFEPANALTSGVDGLDALRTIVAGAPDRLLPGGALVVEHGYNQAGAVRELLRDAGFSDLASLRDLAGISRVAAGRFG